MSTAGKKGKVGRPRRAASEQLQRVSLSLKPSQLLALEVVARDRRTSLSQAAEYLIEQQFEGYQVDGASAADAVKESADRVMLFVESAPEEAPIRNMSREDVIAKMLSSPAGRSLFMPRSLRQPAERYFADFFDLLMRNALRRSDYPQLIKLLHVGLIDDDAMGALLDASELFEKAQLDVAEAARRYTDLLIQINT